jgi:uncharacterized protein YjbJ (UPF0337 family)
MLPMLQASRSPFYAPYRTAFKRIRELRNASFTQVRNQMGEIMDKVKGKIKQTAGGLAGDKKLEREGEVDEAKGGVKGTVANVKHAVKDAARK